MSNTKHGYTTQYHKSKEWRAWIRARERCFNKNYIEYRLYGGRGIKVCEEWRDNFARFIEHIGPCPSPKHSLDRIDSNGHYEPGNVRWATQIEQANNKRNNTHLTLNGQTRTLPEWARLIGMGSGTLRNRLKIGWSVHDALTKPLRIWPSQATSK